MDDLKLIGDSDGCPPEKKSLELETAKGGRAARLPPRKNAGGSKDDWIERFAARTQASTSCSGGSFRRRAPKSKRAKGQRAKGDVHAVEENKERCL